MAHSANRSIDFAPAWLKLPEANQDTRRQESTHNPSNQQHTSVYPYRHSISHSDHHSAIDPAYYNQFQRNSSTSNQHQHSRISGRSHTHSYRSGASSAPQHPIQLQRSQSTGSYTEGAPTRPLPTNSNTNRAVSKPLEEEFPLLCGGSTTAPPALSQSQRPNQVNSTAQWRVKERTREDTNKGASNQQNDNLLTSNMSGGKVYRAQVKPVKRTNMIPISNGSNSSNATIKGRENGEHNDYSHLSSSLDKEKKFLQELGWNEDEESDDDCVIPEQDPAKLEQIMMEAKLARQRLLMKSKQSMKTMPSALIPDDDDLPSSSDNSDIE